jgi:hypothetical protein
MFGYLTEPTSYTAALVALVECEQDLRTGLFYAHTKRNIELHSLMATNADQTVVDLGRTASC